MLGVGNIFPSFDLPSCDEDNNLGTTKFNDESCKDHWYVFYFYPKDFTFVCPTEISELVSVINFGFSALLIKGSSSFKILQ